ncbi:hypothetical protein [Mesorhizobium sp. NPDC059025]|uniref:hypothetical protein n=1 Tax=unclassified Mesorhizobium TaxID=325217 RepID=UPI003699F1A0
MTYSVTPIIGLRIGEVIKTGEDAGGFLGTVVTGNDGHDYILAQATGNIANAATAVLTEPAMTMASGAGAWTNTSPALVSGDRAWFKKTAI